MNYEIEINSLGNQINLSFEPKVIDRSVYGTAEFSIWDIDFNCTLQISYSDLETDSTSIKDNPKFDLKITSILGGFLQFKQQKENVVVNIEYSISKNPFSTNSNAKFLKFDSEFYITLDAYENFLGEYMHLFEWLKKENELV